MQWRDFVLQIQRQVLAGLCPNVQRWQWEKPTQKTSQAAQIVVRGESSIRPVPSLCREVGGSSCISVLPSFSWELKTECRAALPVRCSLCSTEHVQPWPWNLLPRSWHRESCLTGSWYLLALSNPAQLKPSCEEMQLLGMRHVLWCCAFPGMLLLGLLSVSPGETIPSHPGFDVRKQVR